MIKGIQRRMIVVRMDKSSSFEEAYFLLKTDIAEPSARDENAMLREANRIIAENSLAGKSRRSELKKKLSEAVPPFLWGGLFGVVVISLIWLVTVLS